jgi:hypothetical protein
MRARFNFMLLASQLRERAQASHGARREIAEEEATKS